MTLAPRFNLTFLGRYGIWRIEVDGADDAATAARLSATVERIGRAGCPIVVDLSAVQLVGGAVLTAVNSSGEKLARTGCEVRLVQDPSGRASPNEPSPTRGLVAYATLDEAVESLGRIATPRAG
jgi:hypothetical protein